MKKIIISILLLVSGIAYSNNGPEPCNCTYPLKTNTCWTTGPKGGLYCINKNGNKTYMPKHLKTVKTDTLKATAKSI